MLLELGLIQLESDPCIFIKSKVGDKIYVGVYVDDIQMVGRESSITNWERKLSQYFQLTNTPGDSIFLGIQVETHVDQVCLSQESCPTKALQRFGLENCNPVKTPGDTNQKTR